MSLMDAHREALVEAVMFAKHDLAVARRYEADAAGEVAYCADMLIEAEVTLADYERAMRVGG